MASGLNGKRPGEMSYSSDYKGLVDGLVPAARQQVAGQGGDIQALLQSRAEAWALLLCWRSRRETLKLCLISRNVSAD